MPGRADARAAAARLLDQLAGRDNLDIHTFDRAAHLADRVLTRPIDHLADDARPLPAGYNNGQATSRRRQHRPALATPGPQKPRGPQQARRPRGAGLPDANRAKPPPALPTLR